MELDPFELFLKRGTWMRWDLVDVREMLVNRNELSFENYDSSVGSQSGELDGMAEGSMRSAS